MQLHVPLYTSVLCDLKNWPNLFTILEQVLFIRRQTSVMAKHQIVCVPFDVFDLRYLVFRIPP